MCWAKFGKVGKTKNSDGLEDRSAGPGKVGSGRAYVTQVTWWETAAIISPQRNVGKISSHCGLIFADGTMAWMVGWVGSRAKAVTDKEAKRLISPFLGGRHAHHRGSPDLDMTSVKRDPFTLPEFRWKDPMR